MQQAAQAGDRAAYEAAKEQYAYAFALEKAKHEVEKAKAQSRVNAVDDRVRQVVSEAEDRISALKASGDDDILTLEVPDSPRVDSVQQGLDDVQNLLNGVGLVPGAGEPADGLNALISLLRGDYAGMMLSAFSAIPFIGWAGTVGKAGKYALEGADEAIEAGEAVIKGTGKAAGELVESAGDSWYKADGSLNLPPNYGAITGTEKIIDLQPGSKLGRFGAYGKSSDFVTSPGSAAETLSLPPYTDTSIYQEFTVLKPIPGVAQSTVAPWGGSIGGGIQYRLPMTIDDLLLNGYICK